MRQNRFFDWDDDDLQIWELLSWNLPGIERPKKHHPNSTRNPRR